MVRSAPTELPGWDGEGVEAGFAEFTLGGTYSHYWSSPPACGPGSWDLHGSRVLFSEV